VFVVLGSIRCSVCDSSKGNKDCVTHPPAAQLCEDYDYCIAVAKYTNDGKSKIYCTAHHYSLLVTRVLADTQTYKSVSTGLDGSSRTLTMTNADTIT